MAVQINKDVKTKTNPFISVTAGWDDKKIFGLPPNLMKGIIDELNFPKPSKIQVVSIPMVS